MRLLHQISTRADERVRITNTRGLRPAGGTGLTVGGRGPPLRSITPSFNLPFNLSLNTPLNLSLDLSLDLSFDLPLLIYHWICHWVALAMKHLLFNSSIYHWICHWIYHWIYHWNKESIVKSFIRLARISSERALAARLQWSICYFTAPVGLHER